MMNLGPKLRQLGELITHWCPACEERHYINTVGDEHPVWNFNGNAEAPTFNPSVNVRGVCHYNITDGKIIFHADSKHALAGTTVDLPNLQGY